MDLSGRWRAYVDFECDAVRHCHSLCMHTTAGGTALAFELTCHGSYDVNSFVYVEILVELQMFFSNGTRFAMTCYSRLQLWTIAKA